MHSKLPNEDVARIGLFDLDPQTEEGVENADSDQATRERILTDADSRADLTNGIEVEALDGMNAMIEDGAMRDPRPTFEPLSEIVADQEVANAQGTRETHAIVRKRDPRMECKE